MVSNYANYGTNMSMVQYYAKGYTFLKTISFPLV